ncbi:MAG TPA: cupredoxin domain-containing protein, partial [Actinomycetota bacterium]|nr:cupredoxin domain-containing protein [Actinomycetota bacterium]
GGGGGSTIVVQDFAFSPSSLDVSAGEVTLTVTNEDSAEHTFTLDDGSSDTDLPPGETVEVTLDLSSTVGFHCELHPSMTGTLNVG